MWLTYGEPNVFSEALMDRSRGPMFASPVVLFVTAVAVVMIAAAMVYVVLPALWKLAALLLALIPVAITILGIASCVSAGKPGNITLLWVIIMILAPFFGPLLWFAWGRKNT
jgi:hypothetical protein